MTTSIAEHVDELARELLGQHPCHGAPATVDLDDGRTLRLHVDVDDWPVLDLLGDGFGVFAWARQNHDGYRAERPSDFDGNAEILQRDYPHVMWWQPPADGPKRGTPEFAHMRRHLMSLLEEGFYVVRVEMLDGTDHYGAPIVRDAEVLGGVDLVWCDLGERERRDAELREIVAGMVAELLSREED